MTSKLYINKVGGGDIELTAFTGRKGIPFFDGDVALIEMGMRCANGEASASVFKLMDPDAELPRVDFAFNLPAHKLVTWTEDAPGVAVWLSRGRTSEYDGGRGLVAVDDQVEFDVTVDDGNIELRGQAFTEAWVRPAETDFARIAALREYTLNGASSTAPKSRDTCSITVSNTHLCPNTNTVTMPAKTYPVGTQPQDVIAECADTAGKIYSVAIHHTGGSHLCLLYILETDHTTYASAIKISDNLADWDPEDATAPVYEPHWDSGKATMYRGAELLSGLVNIYGADQSVFVEDTGNITAYDYWVDSHYDAASQNATQAASVASSLLTYRGVTQVTHRVSIIMLASQVDLVTAGMSLEIKAAAAIAGQYLDTYQTRRVAECKFKPMPDGRYSVYLELDRGRRRGGYSPGKTQPAATTPSFPAVIGTPEICIEDCQNVNAGWFGDGNLETSPPFTATLFNGDDYGELTGSVITVDQDTTGGHTLGVAFAGNAPSTVNYTFALGPSGGYFSGRIALPAIDPGVGQSFQFWPYNPDEPLVGPYLALIRNSDLSSIGTGNDTYIRAIGLASSAWFDLGIPSDADVVLRFKLRLIGLTAQVKVWKVGELEPDWQLSTTRGETTPFTRVRGYFGLYGDPAVVTSVMDEIRYCELDCDDVATAYHGEHYGPVVIASADGATSIFTLPSYPGGGYVPGTLDAMVDGISQPTTVVDADAGTFDFGLDPDAGDTISASWRVPL